MNELSINEVEQSVT